MSNYFLDEKFSNEPEKVLKSSRNDRSRTYPQFLAVLAANLANTVSGTVIGWTSPTLPILEGPDSPIPITKNENSWIASLMPLGAVFGPFAAGYLADRYGRKNALLFSAIPAMISWISLAAGRSVPIVYAARFLGGFAIGWIFTVAPMYGGEIADKAVRGAILSLLQIFIVFGLLFDYCIGPYVPYMWLSVGAAFIPLIFVLASWWMPESPYYLLGIGKADEAKKALQWLRGKKDGEVLNELINIQASVEKSKCETGSFKDLFSTRGTTKGFLVSLGLMAFQQFSGINVVLFNSQSIFEKAGGFRSPEESTIVTGVIMLIASTTTPFVVDRLGRKALLITSATGMAIAQAILGLCFYLEKGEYDTSVIRFLPLAAVIGYIIIYSIGFGPLPWAIMGELFPENVKPLASTLTSSFCWFLAFLVTLFFNHIVEAFGNDYTFWLFSGCCFVAIFFVYFCLPETKGKSLAEIQKLLNNSSS